MYIEMYILIHQKKDEREVSQLAMSLIHEGRPANGMLLKFRLSSAVSSNTVYYCIHKSTEAGEA